MKRLYPLSIMCAFRAPDGRLMCQLPATHLLVEYGGANLLVTTPSIEESSFCRDHADTMAARP